MISARPKYAPILAELTLLAQVLEVHQVAHMQLTGNPTILPDMITLGRLLVDSLQPAAPLKRACLHSPQSSSDGDEASAGTGHTPQVANQALIQQASLQESSGSAQGPAEAFKGSVGEGQERKRAK